MATAGPGAQTTETRRAEDIAGLTAPLAAFTHDLAFEGIPVDTRERVKDLLIDALGCALAADAAEETPSIEALARQLGDGAEATVVGRSAGLSLGGATLFNAYRVTALTACDVYTTARFHVTPEVVPAALAVAERDHLDGRSFLVALTAGMEVATRIASAVDYPAFRARGWHTPGVVGPFGSAAAVAKLRGLDATGTLNALGLAGSQSAGTFASWGTPTVKFHQARAALAGLLAGLLAETGFTAAQDVLGNPDGGIFTAYTDGGRPERLRDGLGQRWELERISIRPSPAATPLQPVISALVRLQRRGLLARDRVRRIRVHVAPVSYDAHAAFRHPRGTFEALLSIDYVVAAMLEYGELGFPQFQAAAYSRRDLHALIDDAIEVRSDPALDQLGARVEVEDLEGRVETQSVALPDGHPDLPASRGSLVEKFLRGAQSPLGEAGARRVVEQLADVEALSDIADLCRLLRPT